MAYGMKRSELQAMAEAKLADADLLRKNGRPSSAYYLAGYAVEFALKACIARQMGKEVIPDKDFVTKIYIHDLANLVRLAGLELIRQQRGKESERFNVFWAITKDWSEQSRYEIKQAADADYLLEAITDQNDGVLQWIKLYW